MNSVILAAMLLQSVEIVTVHGSPTERETADRLSELLERHDLSPWLFTRHVRIDSEAIPHSHPALTLHSRHRRQEILLLSTFLHEQIHWFLEARPESTAGAVEDLEKIFPQVPVGFPDGADSRRSTYEHLVVTYLEREALVRVVGQRRAQEAMRFWEGDHYRWIYRTLDGHAKQIGEVVSRHALRPDEKSSVPRRGVE